MEEKDNYRSGQLESVELPEEDDTDDSSEVKGMVVETRDKRRKEDNNPFSAAPQKQIRTRSPRTPDKEILAQRKKNPQRKRRPVKKTPLARKNTAESRKKDGRPKDDRVFMFEGKQCNMYSAMVEAKREQNKAYLEKTGLLETAQHVRKWRQQKHSSLHYGHAMSQQPILQQHHLLH
jgi:hypothetical protein